MLLSLIMAQERANLFLGDYGKEEILVLMFLDYGGFLIRMVCGFWCVLGGLGWT